MSSGEEGEDRVSVLDKLEKDMGRLDAEVGKLVQKETPEKPSEDTLDEVEKDIRNLEKEINKLRKKKSDNGIDDEKEDVV